VLLGLVGSSAQAVGGAEPSVQAVNTNKTVATNHSGINFLKLLISALPPEYC